MNAAVPPGCGAVFPVLRHPGKRGRVLQLRYLHWQKQTADRCDMTVR